MTPERYCEQRAGGRGSSLYYSLLFTAPVKRRALLAVHAFREEVCDVATDPAVHMQRLAWWSEEMSAISRGHARHPVSRALAEAITTFGLDMAQIVAILAAVAHDTQTPQHNDYSQLEATVLGGGGALAVLTAAICGYEDPRTPERARALGMHLHFAERLRDLGRDARRGRLAVPLEDLGRFGLEPRDVFGRTRSDALDRLVAFETARADRWLGESLEALPRIDRARLLPLRIQTAIQRAMLHEIGRDGAQVLERAVALTPLRKLWIAWRSARRSSPGMSAADPGDA